MVANKLPLSEIFHSIQVARWISSSGGVNAFVDVATRVTWIIQIPFNEFTNISFYKLARTRKYQFVSTSRFYLATVFSKCRIVENSTIKFNKTQRKIIKRIAPKLSWVNKSMRYYFTKQWLSIKLSIKLPSRNCRRVTSGIIKVWRHDVPTATSVQSVQLFATFFVVKLFYHNVKSIEISILFSPYCTYN